MQYTIKKTLMYTIPFFWINAFIFYGFIIFYLKNLAVHY
jgi:hypothetical protein